jgi:catechol 2,3-dioxygenase-like lactoylglutathione lyase family enzyme
LSGPGVKSIKDRHGFKLGSLRPAKRFVKEDPSSLDRAMIRIRSLDHFVLRVRDLDRSLGFYQGLLGLSVEGLEACRRGERPFVSLRIGESLLDLVPDPSYDPGAASAGGFVHFCVTLGDLAAALQPLRNAGVRFVHEEPVARGGARGVGLSIYVEDPDRYVVELKEH